MSLGLLYQDKIKQVIYYPDIYPLVTEDLAILELSTFCNSLKSESNKLVC